MLRSHCLSDFVIHFGRFVDPPVYTLAIGNAWGEAALLLAAGAKGNRAALSSAKIMLRQVLFPILFCLSIHLALDKVKLVLFHCYVSLSL